MQRIDPLSGVKLNWLFAVHGSTSAKGIGCFILDTKILLNISDLLCRCSTDFHIISRSGQLDSIIFKSTNQ